MKTIMIAAIASNNAIGKDNKIPWHIPQDFKLFKETTMGSTILMGLSTYESIGKPLPGRKTIILSFEPMTITGADVCTSIPQALEKAKGYAQDLYVCGGASVYKAFMERAEELYISHVKGEYEGDTFFPKIDEEEWESYEEVPYEEFTFKKYRRKEG